VEGGPVDQAPGCGGEEFHRRDDNESGDDGEPPPTASVRPMAATVASGLHALGTLVGCHIHEGRARPADRVLTAGDQIAADGAGRNG